MELTVEDRFAIQDLYAKYCYTVDRSDAEGWADTFTEDGKRIYDDNPGAPNRAGRTVVGREALIELQSMPRPLRVRHWHSLPQLTDKGDYIEGVVYGIVIDVGQDPPQIIAHFTYTDELVKLASGEWRMRSRASARDLLVLETQG